MATKATLESEANDESEWDRPFTDLELQAIDAVFQSATPTSTSLSSSPIKKRNVRSCADDSGGQSHRITRRRLPDSLFSFSLSPCPSKNGFRSSEFQYQGNTKMRLPPMRFTGQIVYSRTFCEVEKAAEDLLNFVEAKRRQEGKCVLGFDIEWQPNFRKGEAPKKAAVMQICGDINYCFVLHIIHSGIPQKLQSLLEDLTSLKVGVGIGNDAAKVFNDHNVSVKSLEDLSDLANRKLVGEPKKWGLASLTETLICKQLPKPKRIRLGNWEANVLTKEQLQYAATDAFASWYLHEVLTSLPEPVNNKSEDLGT